MLDRAVSCARTLGFPVMERRCLTSLKELRGPTRVDRDIDARLAALEYLGDLAGCVTRVLGTPSLS